jgi:hypothetical protein
MNRMSHPLISDYANRHGIPDTGRTDERLTVIVDDKYRVHLQPGPDGSVVLLSRLGVLPAPGPTREKWLYEVGKLAVGVLSKQAAACVVNSRDDTLWLQQVQPAATTPSLDEAIGTFANALSFWKGAMRRWP